MSAAAIDVLLVRWKAESEAAQQDLPDGVVTKELMRYLVLQWVLEIEKAMRA